MVERLVECATCSRHVKASDPTCPFCRAPMRAAPPTTRAPYARLAAGAAVAASVATALACTTYVQNPNDERTIAGEDGSTEPPSGVVFYGLASFDGSLIGPPFRDAATGARPEDAALTDATNDAITEAATDSDAIADAADGAAIADAATDSDAPDD